MAWKWVSLAVSLGIGFALLTGYGMLLGAFLPRTYGAGGQSPIPLASAHLAVSMLAALLLSLGLANKDLNRLDGDMEWLLTLPISIRALYAMRAGERTLLNVYAWVMIYPLLLAMRSQGEMSWSHPVEALLLSVPLFLLVALGYLVVESAARVWLPKMLINGLQFAGTLGGLALLMTLPTRPASVAPLAELPWPSVSQAVSVAFFDPSSGLSTLLWHLTRYIGETAALLGVGYGLLHFITSRGAVVGAGIARGRRRAGGRPPLNPGFPARGMVQRELLLLWRDKKTLHVALVLPSVLLFPLFLLAQTSSGERLFASPTHLPVLAFWAGAIPVMTTANLLHGEGKSVWLLFTLPRSLARMLVQRALVWVPICVVYAALVLAYGLGRQPVSRELVLGSAYCFFGLTLLTLISAGLGLHMVEPDALESEQASSRGGLQVLLLGMLLAAFGSGFYADAWLRVSLSVIVAAAAYGIWQDVSRRLPFLLEPDLQPPPRIGVSDALVCVLLIVVLEVFGARLAMSHLELRPWPAQGVAFVGAVALVAAGASLLFWRQGLRNVGASLGLTWGGSVRGAVQQGLVWAVPAVVTAVVFLLLLRHWPWLGTWGNSAGLSRPNLERSTDTVILLLLTCVGAPLVEELLFRGMLYRSLRESFSPRASALCAAVVLGAIHPGLACISVFLFSLFAAASFERSRSLVSPIVVHAAYNSTLFVVSALLGSA